MSETLGFEVGVPLGFDAAVAATSDALKAEGFGILTVIDLRAAFKEKLNRDFRPYTILGACNPTLAFAAVTADPAVGLLLPCNVTVEAQDEGHVLVRLTNPQALLAAGTPGKLETALADVAADARRRMERVAAALARLSAPAA